MTRDQVTSASRVMLPAYAVFSAAVGSLYAFGDPERYAAPVWDRARDVMPISAWGWLILSVSAMLVTALLLQRRRLMILGMCLALGVYVVWTTAYVFSIVVLEPSWPFIAFREGIPPTPIPLWGLVATSHLASLRSLTRD